MEPIEIRTTLAKEILQWQRSVTFMKAFLTEEVM
jgi:hypothetical protein